MNVCSAAAMMGAAGVVSSDMLNSLSFGETGWATAAALRGYRLANGGRDTASRPAACCASGTTGEGTDMRSCWASVAASIWAAVAFGSDSVVLRPAAPSTFGASLVLL